MSSTKRNILIFMAFFLCHFKVYPQSKGCIDINNRLIYSFPVNSFLHSNPIEGGINYIIGGFKQFPDSGVVLCKTYLDTVIWAKRYKSDKNIPLGNVIQLPDSSIIANSTARGVTDLFLTRFSKDGTVIWSKKYNSNVPNAVFQNSNQTHKLLAYKNDFVFCIANFNIAGNRYLTIIKLDLFGEIIWNKTFTSPTSEAVFLTNPPTFSNDTVVCVANVAYTTGPLGSTDSMANVVVKLNSSDGAVISSTRIKTVDHPFIKGMSVFYSKINPDKSLTISGNIGRNFLPLSVGIRPTGIPFVAIFDEQLHLKKAAYYSHPPTVRLDGEPNFHSSTNDMYQTTFLLTDLSKQLAYNLYVDSSLEVISSHTLSPNNSSSFIAERSLQLMNNGSTVFGFGFSNPTTSRLEYFNISNAAERNSLNCFGIDTSVFQKNNFNTQNNVYNWQAVYDNFITSSNFILLEDVLEDNTQVICTAVSVCDSIKIKGQQQFCFPNDRATYTIYKNPTCKRKIIWKADSSSVKIIAQPTDTTVTVQFLKNFRGFITASIEGCVLSDSFYVEVNSHKPSIFLGADSILCPGKTITLDAGSGFKSYQWQDNSNNQNFTLNSPGTYHVKAIDSCGNDYSDTILIKPLDINFNFTYPNKICLYDTVTINIPPQLKDINWSPFNEGLLKANKLLLFPSQTTVFNFAANRFQGCLLTDTLLITVEKCPFSVYIPNAFTPNNDGKNDIFKPIVTGRLLNYKFEIYNRYGQLIFNTSNSNNGWDGSISSMSQNPGSFVWVCTYQFINQPTITKKGTVMLIR